MGVKHRILITLVTFFLIGVLNGYTWDVSAQLSGDSPEIRHDAPNSLQMNEDSGAVYFDLYDIYNGTNASLNFTLRTGNDWNATFNGNILNATVEANDTLRFEPLTNMHGSEHIVINATNSNGSSTLHDMNVIVVPVNDPPVIETIGNLLVKNVDVINMFAYQNEWFNETVTASDIDGDRLVFIDNTSLFDIDYLTGNISFKPVHQDVGVEFVNITASDINGSNCEAWINVKFTILNVNDPPTARIVQPENGTVYYKSRYLFFSGRGDDPDKPFGETLTYEWHSDIDGVIGKEANISVYDISVGTHTITLRVTDSGGLFAEDNITLIVKRDPYDTYYYIELYTEDDILIMKQGETVTIEMEVVNEGSDKDNVSFEIVKYFGFEGDVTLGIDHIELEADDYAYFNVTITASEETDIGVYFIDICSKSGMKEEIWDDNYSYYFYGLEDTESLKVIVTSDDSGSENKEAAKPVWEVGYIWNFTMGMKDYYYDMEGTMSMEITEETTKKVNKEKFEVFVQEVEVSLETSEDSDDDNGYYDSYEMEMTGDIYIQKSDLATVSEEMEAEMTYRTKREKETYSVETMTTYDPPLDEYDFPIKSGEDWTSKTTKTEESEYEYLDGYDYSEYDDGEETTERSSYLCLGTEEVTTPAGTFEAFLIMEYDKESDYYYWDDDDYRSRASSFYDDMDEEDYSIDYYCPDIGMTVKHIVYELEYYYDYDEYGNGKDEEYQWEETMRLELSSYSLVPESGEEPVPDDDKKKDTDDDEIPDYWESLYNISDPEGDEDNDGYTNLDEYLNGTNPLDKEDSPEDPIDKDGDGMPDAWEEDHGLNPLDPNDANLDLDRDGYSNLDEYEARTSPEDKEDHPYNLDTKKSDSGDFNMTYLYTVILLGIIIIIAVIALVRKRKTKDDQGDYLGRYEEKEYENER